MVHAIQERHPKTFEVDLRPAAEHQEELAGYELGTHGVVCLGSDGAVLWKHPGHDVSPENIEAGLQQILETLARK